MYRIDVSHGIWVRRSALTLFAFGLLSVPMIFCPSPSRISVDDKVISSDGPLITLPLEPPSSLNCLIPWNLAVNDEIDTDFLIMEGIRTRGDIEHNNNMTETRLKQGIVGSYSEITHFHRFLIFFPTKFHSIATWKIITIMLQINCESDTFNYFIHAHCYVRCRYTERDNRKIG